MNQNERTYKKCNNIAKRNWTSKMWVSACLRASTCEKSSGRVSKLRDSKQFDKKKCERVPCCLLFDFCVSRCCWRLCFYFPFHVLRWIFFVSFSIAVFPVLLLLLPMWPRWRYLICCDFYSLRSCAPKGRTDFSFTIASKIRCSLSIWFYTVAYLRFSDMFRCLFVKWRLFPLSLFLLFSVNKSHFLNWIFEKWSRPKYLHGHSHTYLILYYVFVIWERKRTWISYHTMHEMVRSEMAQLNPYATLYSLRMNRFEMGELCCVYWNKRCEMDGNATFVGWCVFTAHTHTHSLHAQTPHHSLRGKHFQPCTEFYRRRRCACAFVCICVTEKHSVSNDKILCPVDAILAYLHTIPSTFTADVRLHSSRMALLCLALHLSHAHVPKQQQRQQRQMHQEQNAMQKTARYISSSIHFTSVLRATLCVEDGELQRQQKCKRQAKTRNVSIF